jgi:hypothetical protein
MSKKDDGGLAFPFFDRECMNTPEWGMSLRDYFAAKVDVSVYTPFENLKAIHGRLPTVGEMAEYIAGLRYIEADLMLAERAK